MKKLLCCPLAVVCLTGLLQAESLQSLSVSNQLSIAGYTVTGLGPDTRTWSGSILRSNQAGGLILTTNRVVELGLYNRWAPERSQWVESRPELVVTNRGVIGRGARHEVFFAANLNTLGAIWVRLPATSTTPAQYLKTHVMALAYACGGTNYVLAQVKDSVAEVLDNNRVLYRDAFEELKADILYSYSGAGLMQFVILREQPPTPESLGLSDDSVKLVAITEIVEGPEPSVTMTNTVDPQIGFGPMSMTHGRAFLLRDQDQAGLWQGPHVLKRYEVIRDRRFLFESVDLSRIQDQLLTLPAAGTVTNASLRKPMRLFAAGTLPPAPPQANASVPAVRQASLLAEHAGFALDWDLVHTHSGDFTFESAAQTTYVLRHQTHLSGRTIFEPGAVVLVQEGPLHIDGPLEFATSQTGGNSNKVIFSALTDPAVAGVLGQQDLPPERAYGPALAVSPEDYRAVIGNIEIRYAGPAVVLNVPSALPTVQVAIEDQGSATVADHVAFWISRRDGDFSQPLTVRFRAKVGAVLGADAAGLVSSSADIPANQDSVQVSLPVSQDAAFDGPVAIRLQPDEQGSYLLSEAASSLAGQGIQPMTATPAPAGMVAWWKAESNGNDSSVNGHNASTLNAVSYVAGKVNQAFSFNGTSSYVEVPNISGLNNNLTIEFWVRRQRVDSHAEFIVEQGGDYTWGQQNFGVSFHPYDNKLCFTWANGYRLSGGSISDTTTWHHCAVVAHQGDANPAMYIDGVLQSVDAGGGTINLHSTSLPLHIGAQRDTYYNYYSQTLIDELTIYNACLTASDIWAIYTAGADGKTICTAAAITSQPQSQTVNQGGNANFSVAASGSAPLSYQWYKNDDYHPVSGGISSTLSLQNVQTADAGNYYAKVSNCGGTVSSASATLTVNPNSPSCTPLPANAVGWWKAENNVSDNLGNYNGSLTGGAGYALGNVGQAFSFDGSSGYATVANVPDLTSQLTIEFWLKRQRLVGAYEYLVEKGGDWSYGQQNFALQLHGADNDLVFTWAGGYRGAGAIADYNWHHCAVTAIAGQANPQIYIDGVLQSSGIAGGTGTISFPSYNRPLHIGAQIDPNSGWNYYSQTLIDEMTIYSRALSQGEIQAIYTAGAAGKCASQPVAPTITTQPQGQTLSGWSDATFTVAASGTPALNYQWRFNGTDISGATTSSYTRHNIEPTHAGQYSAYVWNSAGNATSASATLTVTQPDSNGDGIPDWWMLKYFGSLNQTASADSDNDGLSNYQEFILGSSPTVPAVGDQNGRVLLNVYTVLR